MDRSDVKEKPIWLVIFLALVLCAAGVMVGYYLWSQYGPGGTGGGPVVGEAVRVVSSKSSPRVFRIAIDGVGGLHLVWGDGQALYHQAQGADGSWSPPEVLSGDFDTLFGLVEFLPNPRGQVCIFIDGALDSNQPSTTGVYMRCRVGGQWSRLSERLPGDYAATFPPAVAFAPDLNVRLAHATGPGNAPVQFAGTPLSSDDGTVRQLRFLIDEPGNYHLVWQRYTGVSLHTEYRFSLNGGQTWSEISAPDDMPLLTGLALAPGLDGGIHLGAWAGAAGVFYKGWSPDGAVEFFQDGWSEKVDVRDGLEGGVLGDLAAGPDGLAHIVWVNSLMEIRHYVRQDTSGGWSSPQPVTDQEVSDIRLAIDRDGGRHFMWRRTDGGLYYALRPAPAMPDNE